ncbi:hypothetical protein T4C_9683, partial [Trichinella pseudospiralis]
LLRRTVMLNYFLVLSVVIFSKFSSKTVNTAFSQKYLTASKFISHKGRCAFLYMGFFLSVALRHFYCPKSTLDTECGCSDSRATQLFLCGEVSSSDQQMYRSRSSFVMFCSVFVNYIRLVVSWMTEYKQINNPAFSLGISLGKCAVIGMLIALRHFQHFVLACLTLIALLLLIVVKEENNFSYLYRNLITTLGLFKS